MKKLILIGIGAAAVAGFAAALLLDPNYTLLGRLKGERFYDEKPTTYWSRALKSDDPTVQAEAPRKLKQGGAAAVPVLVELLSGERGSDWASAKVRWMAAEILGEIGPDARSAAPALIQALKDNDAHVRAVAASALAAVGP